MKLNLSLLFIVLIGLISCNPKSNPAATDNIAGESFTAKKVLSIDEFFTVFEKKGGGEYIVKGTVESVCQVKGCWMNMQTTNKDKDLFVKFKDYGFFMPLDLAGKEITMKGDAYVEVTPVDELKHYAEDAGASQEEIDAITEPKEEVKFMASGVILPN